MLIRRLAEWSFLILVFSLCAVRPLYLSYGNTEIPATDLIFVPVFLFTAAAVLLGQLPLRFDPFFVYLSFYTGTMLIATAVSTDPSASWVQMLGELYLSGLCVCTYFLATRQFLRKIAITWTAGAILSCVLVFVGVGLFAVGHTSESTNYFLSKPGSLPFTVVPRMNGLFLNPNMLCDYLNVALVLAFLTVKEHWLPKLAGWVAVGVIGISAIFTFSPGIGGLILSASLCFVGISVAARWNRTILSIAAAVALFIFCIALVSPDTKNTDQDVRIPIANTIIEPSVRVLVWENTLQRSPGHLITGRGVGAQVAQLRYSAINGEQQFLTDAHNMWFNVYGQEGLLGLAAFAALVVFVFYRGFYGKDAAVWILFSGFVGAFVYQGLSGSFEDTRHLWVLIGLIAGLTRPTLDEPTPQ